MSNIYIIICLICNPCLSNATSLSTFFKPHISVYRFFIFFISQYNRFSHVLNYIQSIIVSYFFSLLKFKLEKWETVASDGSRSASKIFHLLNLKKNEKKNETKKWKNWAMHKRKLFCKRNRFKNKIILKIKAF